MAILHLTGTPIETRQGDLTPLQRAFLAHALPEAWAMLRGWRSSSRAGTSGIDQQLKNEVQRRRAERG